MLWFQVFSFALINEYYLNNTLSALIQLVLGMVKKDGKFHSHAWSKRTL